MYKLINRNCIGHNAVVSTARIEASEIGINILKSGGNYIDAAVAVGFALGVCEPSTSGLGGGGFMVIKEGKKNDAIFIDFREVAPQNASPDMWKLNQEGKVINCENYIGGKSVAVPGELAGLVYVLENYGTMSLEEVIEPSTKLAKDGFVITDMMAEHFSTHIQNTSHLKSDLSLYFKNDLKLRIGEKFKNIALARTLTLISKYGKDIFYKGQIGEIIVNAVTSNNGVLNMKDLERYRTNVQAPVTGCYRGYKIISSSTPNSGGIHIIQILNILENFDISALEVNSSGYLHLFSEAIKKAYLDRSNNLADNQFVDVPIKGLISKEYAQEISKSINKKKSSEICIKNPWNYEHDETTHYSIGDSEGNMVAVTKTINHFCGSCIVPYETGILLNNSMSDFSIDKNNINAVAPFKKPLSTMSPTIILKNDKPYAIIGSPGGSRIICIIVQVISKLIDHNMNIMEAINSPRITEDTNNIIVYEGRINNKVVKELEMMGHKTKKVLNYDIKMGGVQGIKYMDDGKIEGTADPRRDGRAVGY